MIEQLLRLGGSLIPNQEIDRFIPIGHAADALLAEVSKMPGKLPSRMARHLGLVLGPDCERMVNGEVYAIEVCNFHLHRGSIHPRGLYQPVKCATDVGVLLIRVLVTFDGQVLRYETNIKPRTAKTLARIMNLPGGLNDA